jgi:thioredoxin 1
MAQSTTQSLVKHVSDATFETDVLQSTEPVLVDFWAPWCAPCRMVGPILDEMSGEYSEKLTIAKLNVDENQEIPVRYGIRGIPTLILFKDGKVIATKVGALSRAQLKAFVDPLLG